MVRSCTHAYTYLSTIGCSKSHLKDQLGVLPLPSLGARVQQDIILPGSISRALFQHLLQHRAGLRLEKFNSGTYEEEEAHAFVYMYLRKDTLCRLCTITRTFGAYVGGAIESGWN